nr:HAMP domain-containing protein [Fibrobacterota bacterium]
MIRSGFVRASIKAKLFISIAMLLATVLALVFISLMALDSKRTAHDLKNVEGNIRGMIISKGRQLCFNSSIAMRSLAEENSISAIREIVKYSVEGDSDIVYGIFMGLDNKPWALRERSDTGKEADIRKPLEDPMSRWAASLRDLEYKSQFQKGIEIIEFATPVRSGDDNLGFIRFGLTTKSMNEALKNAKLSSQSARGQKIFLFLLVAFFAFLIALLASTYMAARFTRPITALTSSASRIAQGDYDLQFEKRGTDEIAMLAEAFEAMRIKIKDYTQNLKGLVEAKVRQVRDILENIEQGLFTFDLDLVINEDSSKKAALILGVPRLAGHTLAEILNFSPMEEQLFRDWVEIVRNEYPL